ncbi:hypothetical protein [Stutzerimonas nitrititolerans]|uniref:hypothetical protein n=1 Tax=Stutzerimonas nitrititolerans TaxID=2482751 RepID=UPI00289BB925|nr:hypothetical protein [Stutzerimonas nitrititolerans]
MTFMKNFTEVGTFEALYACQKWLRDNGYSYGPTSAMGPVPVLKGDFLIAKWHNLSKAEKQALDGYVDGDFREGPLTLHLKETPEGAQP